ncbi:MAG TPA: PAS domain S-box protein, partial [Terriglobales bacterium]|nr:PAS domain S-box protein [Terriglobales bacterium]
MTYQDSNASGAAQQESSLESRYRKLLHAVPDAILEVDEQGRITILNEAAERMFGYTRAEFLGLNVENLVPAAMRNGHAKHRSSYAD